MTHITDGHQLFYQIQCPIIPSNNLVNRHVMSAGGYSGCHTSNIDLGICSQYIVASNEKVFRCRPLQEIQVAVR